MRHCICIALLIALLPVSSGFGACNVSAQISSGSVLPGQLVQLTIQASGSNISDPDLSVLKDTGWQVIDGPVIGRSYQIMVINGRRTESQTLTWTYTLRCDRQGKQQIPAIPVTVDKQQCLTNPIQVTITSQKSETERSDANARQNGQPTLDDLAFITTSVDRKQVFQGEQIMLTLSIYVLDSMGVDIEIPRNLPLPNLSDFLQGPQNRTVDRANMRGFSYRVQRLEQVIYPVQAGTLTIPAWSWQGRVYWPDRSLFGQSSAIRDFYAPPITITVEALPPSPPEFSGAVGAYRAESVFPRDTLTVGTPVQWAIAITGKGNPDTVGAPRIPPIPWAHISGPEIDLDGRDGGELTKIFTYQLTPLVSGEQELPEIQYVFFAPPLRQYKTVRIPAKKVNVVASVSPSGTENTRTASEGSTQSFSRQDTNAPIVIPIVKDPTGLSSGWRISRWTTRSAFAIALLSPVAVWIVLSLYVLRLNRMKTDRAYARKSRAVNLFEERLRQTTPDEDPGGCIYKAVTDLVSDLLDARESGLTTEEVVSLLAGRISEDELRRLELLLRRCERARYGGADLSVEEVQALREGAFEMAAMLVERLR